jgi:gp16 family phage-associated protein
MEQKQLKTRQEVLRDLRRKGVSIAEYARRIGFDRMTVYHVLHSEKPCNYGKSHKVAVALGIKDGVISDE